MIFPKDRRIAIPMAYAYQTSAVLGVEQMLGSVMRAMGKGWNVLVIATPTTRQHFDALLKMFIDPTQLTVVTLDDIEKISLKNFDLICTFLPREGLGRVAPLLFEERSQHIMVIDPTALYEEYDLISAISESGKSGLVTSYTGTGKGKTTGALGCAAKALGAGKTAAIIQWFKEPRREGDLNWWINEHAFPTLLEDKNRCVFYPMGAGFVGSPSMDRIKDATIHRAYAEEGIKIARRVIDRRLAEFLVLDELFDTLPAVAPTLPYPLLELSVVTDLLERARYAEIPVAVTGRRVIPEFVPLIDRQVSVTEIKHPWSSKHAGAIQGLDY